MVSTQGSGFAGSFHGHLVFLVLGDSDGFGCPFSFGGTASVLAGLSPRPSHNVPAQVELIMVGFLPPAELRPQDVINEEVGDPMVGLVVPWSLEQDPPVGLIP